MASRTLTVAEVNDRLREVTQRQIEVAREVRLAVASLRAQGLSNRAVADLIGVSLGAVQQHINRHRRAAAEGREPALLPTTLLVGSDSAEADPSTVEALRQHHAESRRLFTESQRLSELRKTAPRAVVRYSEKGLTKGFTPEQVEAARQLMEALSEADAARMHSPQHHAARARCGRIVAQMLASGITHAQVRALTRKTNGWIRGVVRLAADSG